MDEDNSIQVKVTKGGNFLNKKKNPENKWKEQDDGSHQRNPLFCCGMIQL